MRKEFVIAKSYAAAWKLCPWAAKISRREGGFMAYESMDEYKAAKKQK